MFSSLSFTSGMSGVRASIAPVASVLASKAIATLPPEVSEVLCLGPVYFSLFGSDFAKAR
jgi:hypothetical protein